MHDFSALTVLLIDDSKTMRGIMKSILADIGFKHIMEASDGSAALEILKREKPDLAICDWNMPNMTGIELLDIVRCSIDLYTTKFIMVTAEADKDHVTQAIQSGISDYILKPFNSKVLLEKILQLLTAKKPAH